MVAAEHSRRQKVLYVCHGHPASQAGGAETYALELYHAMRESPAFEPIFLARVRQNSSHPGTPFSIMVGDSNQYLWHTRSDEFDFFYMTSADKTIYTRYFREFLLAHKPDI